MVKKKRSVYSYAGSVLRVNLNDGSTYTENTLRYAKEWLGASGIGIKILYDELRDWVTPYEPANKIIFGTGALVGTTAPGASKSNVSTLGPVTGGWASSCSDSYLGGQLKCAGYDSIVVDGKAHAPVYLWINDNFVQIRDASHIWGKTTWETLEVLRDELGDSSLHILSIGPAGENLVRGACIIQDKGRAFGRCGTGAVMGSKQLKAIVIKGTGSVRVAEPGLFMEAVAKIRKKFKKSKTIDKFRKYGTLYNFATKQEICGFPYKNFQDCCLPRDMFKAIDPCKTIDKYEIARQSYPGCLIGCSRYLHLTDGPYSGLMAECNQMEVMGTLQARLAIKEPTFMVKANAVCNQLGLDVDAAGGAIGWAMECYEKGLIDEKDTGGIQLNWGNADVTLELIRNISYRQGFGNILAEGCARAADIVGRGSNQYAMHIKGQDLYETCRGTIAYCLGTTTSTRGGGHTTGAAIDARPGLDSADLEKARKIFHIDSPDQPLVYEGKAEMVTYMEALHRANNCLGICHMNTIWWDINMMDLPDLAELYTAASGWETTAEDLKWLAMKQLNLEKAFNLRHTDYKRKDDLPTPRDFSEPIPTGSLAGWKMDKARFNELLDHYYDLHGWDRKTSFPTRKTLEDFNLEFVADDLEKLGKLG
jgi:aldehyde:ferredoxin oxidoreductase